MDYRDLLACFVLTLGGLSLLQLDIIIYRKIGIGLIWLASGLATYFVSHSLPLACAMLGAWVFFPLWEMVFVLRQLRVPRHRELADAHPPREEFEDLGELSSELVAAGFDQVDECQLRPAQHEQFYRIFVHQDGRTHATIGYVAQGPIGFHFVAFTSKGRDERRWVTWDYPLTYGLIMPPSISVYRALHCQTTEELYRAHLDFLAINDVRPEDLTQEDRTPETARAQLEEALNLQVEYNVSRGFLAPMAGADEKNFCYSWRGTLYVAGQVMRDLFF